MSYAKSVIALFALMLLSPRASGANDLERMAPINRSGNSYVVTFGPSPVDNNPVIVSYTNCDYKTKTCIRQVAKVIKPKTSQPSYPLKVLERKTVDMPGKEVAMLRELDLYCETGHFSAVFPTREDAEMWRIFYFQDLLRGKEKLECPDIKPTKSSNAKKSRRR